jgi:hypothetical protein
MVHRDPTTDLIIFYTALGFLAIVFICLIYNQLQTTDLSWNSFLLAIRHSWVGERTKALG